MSDTYEGSIVRLPSVDYVANMKISSWVSENNPHPLNHHHSGLRFSAELPMSTADGRQVVLSASIQLARQQYLQQPGESSRIQPASASTGVAAAAAAAV